MWSRDDVHRCMYLMWNNKITALHTVISLTVLLSAQTSTMIMEIEILVTVYVEMNSNLLHYGYESCIDVRKGNLHVHIDFGLFNVVNEEALTC